MQLRERYRENDVLCVNLISSPGSGKTALLERTLERMDKSVARGRPDRRSADGERCQAAGEVRLPGQADYDRRDLPSGRKDDRAAPRRTGRWKISTS